MIIQSTHTAVNKKKNMATIIVDVFALILYDRIKGYTDRSVSLTTLDTS